MSSHLLRIIYEVLGTANPLASSFCPWFSQDSAPSQPWTLLSSNLFFNRFWNSWWNTSYLIVYIIINYLAHTYEVNNLKLFAVSSIALGIIAILNSHFLVDNPSELDIVIDKINWNSNSENFTNFCSRNFQIQDGAKISTCWQQYDEESISNSFSLSQQNKNPCKSNHKFKITIFNCNHVLIKIIKMLLNNN